MTSTLPKGSITSTIGKAETKVVGVVLQEALTDLIDLGLTAKQAHWNVVGPHFRSVHLQLDELVDSSRQFADAVAERAAALGISPDGRAATVAAGAPAFPAGYLADRVVVELIVGRLDTTIRQLRGHIEATATADPVTQDLPIGMTAELEKLRWMFQAQTAAD
ncbi:Dps family protein [Nocardia crassostreae]|uniref:Dps family protein n=1 Tax=Nocardia crassostreae TaxID=53428 RepID=UPI00082D4BD6|nr:ferritin-like domain-containing protein [Nocardia crassostreae]